jgi:hypothetical protein
MSFRTWGTRVGAGDSAARREAGGAATGVLMLGVTRLGGGAPRERCGARIAYDFGGVDNPSAQVQFHPLQHG